MDDNTLYQEWEQAYVRAAKRAWKREMRAAYREHGVAGAWMVTESIRQRIAEFAKP